MRPIIDTWLLAAALDRERGPLGPLMNGRRAHLEATGMLQPGATHEGVLVIRARNPACARCWSADRPSTM